MGRRFTARSIAALGCAILGLLAVAAITSTPAQAGCNDPAGPGVDWRRCYMEERPFAGVDLTGADLDQARFNRSDLSTAVLRDADARRAKFLSATLIGADLTGAYLREADFTKADLTGAILRDADLTGARFFRAILREADLTDALLNRTDILEADLSGARWIDGERICAEGSLGQCR